VCVEREMKKKVDVDNHLALTFVHDDVTYKDDDVTYSYYYRQSPCFDFCV